MLRILVNSIMLKNLYKLRPEHYQCLNHSEWLFAMEKVELTIVKAQKSFYLTKIGIQYFTGIYNDQIQTA